MPQTFPAPMAVDTGPPPLDAPPTIADPPAPPPTTTTIETTPPTPIQEFSPVSQSLIDILIMLAVILVALFAIGMVFSRL